MLEQIRDFLSQFHDDITISIFYENKWHIKELNMLKTEFDTWIESNTNVIEFDGASSNEMYLKINNKSYTFQICDYHASCSKDLDFLLEDN